MYRPWGILEKIITNPHTTGHAFILWHRRFQHYANYPIQFSSNTVLKSMWLRNLSVLHNISGKLHAVFGTCSVSCVSETWKASPLRRSYKHTHCLLACIYTHERSLVHVDTCMSDDSTENQITVISGEYVQFAGCGTWITQCSPAGFFSENQHRAHMWDKLQLNPALRRRSGLFVDYTY